MSSTRAYGGLPMRWVRHMHTLPSLIASAQDGWAGVIGAHLLRSVTIDDPTPASSSVAPVIVTPRDTIVDAAEMPR